jgi:hypothetical protein
LIPQAQDRDGRQAQRGYGGAAQRHPGGFRIQREDVLADDGDHPRA